MTPLPPLPGDAESKIVTDRLDLEPLLQCHATELYPVLSDSKLHEFTGGEPPASLESLAELYAWREARRSPDGEELWLNWVIRERDGGAAVGYAQASVESSHAWVAWVVGTAWQNRGYASEAARAVVEWLRGLGVREIRACVHPAHVASRKVATHAGLRRTDRTSDGEEVWDLEGTP